MYEIAVLAIAPMLAGVIAIHASPVTALAVPTAGAMIVLALRQPRLVAMTALAVLPFVGLIRRATGSYASTTDPLLIVGPVLAVACVVSSIMAGEPARRTRLRAAILGFLVVGVVGALNPAQGGLSVGIIGAALFVGPMVWFFVGQRFGTRSTIRAMRYVLGAIAVFVLAYGVKQMLVGFTGFEQAWINERLSSYSALSIGGETRPFSTFASAAEYSYFLALGAILFAAWIGRVRWMATLPAVAGFLVATVYAGSRGILVAAMAGVLLVVLTKRIQGLERALGLCVVLSILVLLGFRFLPLSTGSSISAQSKNRVLQGLSDPLNAKVSTFSLHQKSIVNGVVDGLRRPLGLGPGITNRAGSIYGSKAAVSAEHDLPNVLLAYGWPGGIALALLLGRVYRLAQRVFRSLDADMLPLMAFVLVIFGSWFTGGLYSISALVWFFLGLVDRTIEDEPAPEFERRRATPHDILVSVKV